MDIIKRRRIPAELLGVASTVLVVNDFTPSEMSSDKSNTVSFCENCSHQHFSSRRTSTHDHQLEQRPQQNSQQPQQQQQSVKPKRQRGIHRSYSEVGDSSAAQRRRLFLRSQSLFLEVRETQILLFLSLL